jgi:hypothetical protein
VCVCVCVCALPRVQVGVVWRVVCLRQWRCPRRGRAQPTALLARQGVQGVGGTHRARLARSARAPRALRCLSAAILRCHAPCTRTRARAHVHAHTRTCSPTASHACAHRRALSPPPPPRPRARQVSEEVATICAMVSIGSAVFYRPKDKAVHAGGRCVACCVLRAACCVLRAACCVLRAACCVLRAACCVLRAACCVLCVCVCMCGCQGACVGARVRVLVSGRACRAVRLSQHTGRHPTCSSEGAHTRCLRLRTHAHRGTQRPHTRPSAAATWATISRCCTCTRCASASACWRVCVCVCVCMCVS